MERALLQLLTEQKLDRETRLKDMAMAMDGCEWIGPKGGTKEDTGSEGR